MLDYLISNYFILLYFIALILSLVKYRLYYDTILKHLPILFSYTLLSELLGLLVRDIEEVQLIYVEDFYNYNTIIFNIFDIIFFLYFFYIYHQIIKNHKHKKIIQYGSILFLLLCIINLMVQNFYIEPQNLAITYGAILLLFSTFAYLWQLLTEKYRIPLRNNLLFWISTGLTVFYICYPVTMNFLSFNYGFYTKYHLTIYHYAAIGVLYSCIIIGFILMKRFRTPPL